MPERKSNQIRHPFFVSVQSHNCYAPFAAYTIQTELLKCLNEPVSKEAHDAAAAALRYLAREQTMAAYMRTQNLDIILSASDASLITFSTCAGWPVATNPVGNLSKNDHQPWGLFALPRDGRLDLLTKFMRGFHQSLKAFSGRLGHSNHDISGCISLSARLSLSSLPPSRRLPDHGHIRK